MYYSSLLCSFCFSYQYHVYTSMKNSNEDCETFRKRIEHNPFSDFSINRR